MSAKDLQVTLATSRTPAAEVPAASLHEAREIVLHFIRSNGLDAAEVPAACGVIRQGGTPIARVDSAGRVWELRPDGTATGGEIVPDAERLGYLVRILRTAAGVTRLAMGDAVKLPVGELKALELGRRLKARTLRAVMAHPSMSDLQEKAQSYGIDIQKILDTADKDAADQGE